jgi:serine/threonine protein kinase
VSQALAANSNISHYRIIRKLGSGGMGEVWLAEDTRLDRKVALKILPAEFTQDAERVRRFTQEAKAASALNHPNIVTVYDIGESEVGRFIVMELVAGRTLRSLIGADNSMETLLTLGIQIAKALTAAHSAGITHRDIKPDNIMVRDDGYVKVLDFGLARLLPITPSDPEAATVVHQTIPGTVMGTLAYMSPEQASGHKAGPPSDVFSFGIVFYELATGQHPFKSETMIGYLHAITSQAPASLLSVKPELPAALDDLILRMLEKQEDNRLTASDVAHALLEIERHGKTKTLRGHTGGDKLATVVDSGATREQEGFWVAVLPFKARGSNRDLEALAEGLSEEIVTGLSRFSYLRVIARSSTLRYASETSDVRAIGKQLGARYVMEGSLRQAGALLRLAVQLVDATTGAHLWAETYERSFSPEQVFSLQDDLVPRIVSSVADGHGVLPYTISEALRAKDPNELTTYEAILRSFGYGYRLTPEEHAIVRAALEQAVQRSPDSSDAWAMLSMAYIEEYSNGFNPRPDPLERALDAAQRAVEVGASNALAHDALAKARFFRKEVQAFRIEAGRAIELNPLNGPMVASLGGMIAFSGDWERGCALIERVAQFHPRHPGWYWFALVFNAYRKGDYKDALGIALKINLPNFLYSHVATAVAYGQLGDFEAAAASIAEVTSLRPDFAMIARKEFEKWFEPDLLEHVLDGLRKAGLEIPD